MFMPIKIHIQDGGCLVKNMDKELIPTMKLGQNLLGSGIKISLSKDVGSSHIMAPIIQELSLITSQMVMEFGIS